MYTLHGFIFLVGVDWIRDFHAIEPIDYGHYNDGFYEPKTIHIAKYSNSRWLLRRKYEIFLEDIQILRIIFHSSE